MTTANTNAIFGFRDAGKDILKITPLVKLALISFMDVIYQSYSSYIESFLLYREVNLQL